MNAIVVVASEHGTARAPAGRPSTVVLPVQNDRKHVTWVNPIAAPGDAGALVRRVSARPSRLRQDGTVDEGARSRVEERRRAQRSLVDEGGPLARWAAGGRVPLAPRGSVERAIRALIDSTRR